MKTEAQIRAQKRYVERHRERVRAATRKWNKSEKGRKVREAWQKSAHGKAWFLSEHHRKRGVVMAAYGMACACCAESEMKFLAIDHVNGGGRKDRKRIGSSVAFFNEIIKAGFPPQYRLLCHNCNIAIGVHGSCPHTEHKTLALVMAA